MVLSGDGSYFTMQVGGKLEAEFAPVDHIAQIAANWSTVTAS